jgi:hypothetical protein
LSSISQLFEEGQDSKEGTRNKYKDTSVNRLTGEQFLGIKNTDGTEQCPLWLILGVIQKSVVSPQTQCNEVHSIIFFPAEATAAYIRCD